MTCLKFYRVGHGHCHLEIFASCSQCSSSAVPLSDNDSSSKACRDARLLQPTSVAAE